MTKIMNDVYIITGTRTPIGSFSGSLKDLSAPELGSIAIRSAVQKAGIEPSDIDETLMGCVLTGGLGQAPARQAAIKAGIPTQVPATTINKVCGSGMKTVMLGAQAIKLGDNEIVLAGGMESMTNAPYILEKARQGYRMGNGKLIDSMIQDGLWDPYKNVHMGTCGDATAKEYNITREEMDEFSAESYCRAQSAQNEGILAEEITSVKVPQRKGDPLVISEDEEPKRGKIDKLPSLRPAFDKEGLVTAGNASTINDGAAALILASDQACETQGLKPLGKIVAYSSHAQEPEWFTTAPATAIQKLLDKCNLTVNDIDLFEINEAFALVAMYAARELNIPSEKMNVNGGAVSLGHPIGMTGTRLILTALYELRRRKAKYAIASPCIGGGEATAILIEAF